MEAEGHICFASIPLTWLEMVLIFQNEIVYFSFLKRFMCISVLFGFGRITINSSLPVL